MTLENTALDILKIILKYDALSLDDNLPNFGLDSVGALKFVIQLQRMTGIDLTCSQAFDNTTIRKICKSIRLDSVKGVSGPPKNSKPSLKPIINVDYRFKTNSYSQYH